jgi:hypothetical protein
MDFLQDYIVLVTVGVCLCIGYVVKNLVQTNKINKFIPLIVLVVGVFTNIWVNGWTLTPEILLGGMVSGLASTGLHQAFKQFIDKK